MKLLFVHSGEKLKQDNNGNYYTDGSYTKEVWDRYSKLSDDITVMFRKEEKIYTKEEASQKFQPFNKEKYKFVELDNFSKSIKNYFNVKLRNNNKKSIEKEVKKNDFIIGRVPSGAAYNAVKFCKIYNKPYLLEVVGCPWDTLWNHSIKGKILALKEYIKLKKIVKNAPYVTYVSNEFLQKRYPTNGKQLACSDVVLKEIDKDILNERILKIKNKKINEKIVLGTVAAVNVKYKGQQYVIKAISELNKKGYNLEYQLVGGGDNTYLKKIAKKYKVENKVKFLGALPHDKVIEFMKNVDIYVQPSNAEALGRVILEAFSTACPCLGSSTGGISELIQNKYIFKKRNVKDLKRVLINMLSSNLIESAEYSFEKVKEFDKEKLDKKREKFYKEFIERK